MNQHLADAPGAAPDERESAAKAPLLSVGLPVYNGAKWIEQAIDSMLNQSMTDFELIISDNASTDGTESICRGYAERDSRVHYHRNAVNIGLYPNFNRVFELGTGKYFKWAADSDYCLDGFFAKCIAILESEPEVVLAYTRASFLLKSYAGREMQMEYFDDFHLQDERPSTRFRKYLNREKYNNIMHGIIRSAALRETRLHMPWAGSDINMVAELSLRGKFAEVPERLFIRRFDEETSSMLMDRRIAAKREVSVSRSFRQRVLLHVYRYTTVWTAPISAGEKLRVWLYLLKDHIKFPFWVARKLLALPFRLLPLPGRLSRP